MQNPWPELAVVGAGILLCACEPGARAPLQADAFAPFDQKLSTAMAACQRPGSLLASAAGQASPTELYKVAKIGSETCQDGSLSILEAQAPKDLDEDATADFERVKDTCGRVLTDLERAYANDAEAIDAGGSISKQAEAERLVADAAAGKADCQSREAALKAKLKLPPT